MLSKLILSRRPPHYVVLPAVLLALIGGACSNSTSVETVVLPSSTTLAAAPPTSGPATTSDPDEPIVLGSGTIPDSLPADFPIPSEAAVGSTLIDRNRNLTELVIRVPAGVTALVGFFETNLANRGYTVDSSAGDANRWQIALSGTGVVGTVVVTFGSQDVSQAVITVTAEA